MGASQTPMRPPAIWQQSIAQLPRGSSKSNVESMRFPTVQSVHLFVFGACFMFAACGHLEPKRSPRENLRNEHDSRAFTVKATVSQRGDSHCLRVELIDAYGSPENSVFSSVIIFSFVVFDSRYREPMALEKKAVGLGRKRTAHAEFWGRTPRCPEVFTFAIRQKRL